MITGPGKVLYNPDLEAFASDLRQADDLIPVVHSHAGRRSRGSGHLHCYQPTAILQEARRRLALGHEPRLRRTALARWSRPSLPIGADFVRGRNPTLILGDNVLYGHGLPELMLPALQRPIGATVFTYHVSSPEQNGVVDFDGQGRALSIEKPAVPKFYCAVTVLSFYNPEVVEIARHLKPSPRGHLEITNLNQVQLDRGTLQVPRMARGLAWLDTGTPDPLLEAAEFDRVYERGLGPCIAFPEETAFTQGWIGIETRQLTVLAEPLAKSTYGQSPFKALNETGAPKKELEDRDG